MAGLLFPPQCGAVTRFDAVSTILSGDRPDEASPKPTLPDTRHNKVTSYYNDPSISRYSDSVNARIVVVRTDREPRDQCLQTGSADLPANRARSGRDFGLVNDIRSVRQRLSLAPGCRAAPLRVVLDELDDHSPSAAAKGL